MGIFVIAVAGRGIINFRGCTKLAYGSLMNATAIKI
jgi:hypothetical protein